MTKSDRLTRLADARGVIGALAVDQRRSLRQMIARAAGVPEDAISDAQLGEFKSAVARVLTPHTSAVLIDPEYGASAFTERAAGCGLLATYEMDGYENPRPNRMLALMAHQSVYRLREMGADAVKILLSWTPFDTAESNDAKKALIERIGAECCALGMPFFLEPVGYDPGGMDVKSAAYARLKPDIVLDSMREFSDPRYGVDVLKVEFPVDASHVGTVWTGEEAVDHFRRCDEATPLPYIYLSAGVTTDRFTASLRLAAEAGARFSGVLCGRATWQDGVPAFARDGRAAFEEWLSRDGVRNLAGIADCLQTAVPWTQALRR